MENTTEQKTNTGLSYGLIAGGMIVLLSLLLYLGGVDMYLSPVGYVGYLIVIVMAVLAALKTRREQGYLLFNEALKTTFTVFVIATLLQTIFVYILFNFIDESFKQAVAQEILHKTEKMMQRFGASADQIDKAIDSERNVDQFSASRVFLGFAVSSIVSFIICLLISAIVKKNKPVFNQL